MAGAPVLVDAVPMSVLPAARIEVARQRAAAIGREAELADLVERAVAFLEALADPPALPE